MKAETTGFADDGNVRSERNKGIRDDVKVFKLSDRKMDLHEICMKGCRREWRKIRCCLGHVEFVM